MTDTDSTKPHSPCSGRALSDSRDESQRCFMYVIPCQIGGKNSALDYIWWFLTPSRKSEQGHISQHAPGDTHPVLASILQGSAKKIS